MSRLPPFRDFFQALWDQEPFPWQSMLAERVAADAWPAALDLPTASGKTACLEIALYALAAQADRATAERSAGRRVWFVVDRRIVVDEAFARAECIARGLASATSGPLKAVADRLRNLAGTERPVGVARLRGGVFHDDGWARLPSQPAIITSTVDQLGSRLLFRGYGHGLLAAPIFAGLAANDSLILLDEAHCSVPFLQTLRAVGRFRGEQWAEAPLRTPFAFAILSATPPHDIPAGAVFPGAERSAALDHPVLRQRLYARKPAQLQVVEAIRSGADPLIAAAVECACAFASQDKRRVAVMVNRVRTAREIAAALGNALSDQADLVLLTGRLRPFERDALVAHWTPFLRANTPKSPRRPIVLVSTQCLEVGADFSFDALVTEAASLDALRQRFGRLDRMGKAGTSPATILVREPDTDPAKAEPDPIYGTAITNTWNLLSERATGGVVDFGVEALQSRLDAMEDLTPYVAPAGEAPVLLPAHLDLLCQTAPRPVPEPDVQLFLHGKERGAAEVQVVWRADLDPHQPASTWIETIALCPPSSGEMLSVPLYQLRGFLSGRDAGDQGADVEGVGTVDEEPGTSGRPFLLWRGRDRSVRERDTRRIVPGEVVVLPASYGLGPLGQPSVEEGAGAEGLDLWERVLEPAGKRAAVRLTRATLAPWTECPAVAELLAAAEEPEFDREEIAERIDAVFTYEPAEAAAAPAPPKWWRDRLDRVRSGRIEAHPAGGVIMFATARPSRAEEPDLFADDDDLASAAGVEVPHDAHAGLVRRTAGRSARLCLSEEYAAVLETAADWHDVGKLDERFQVVLHQGDELAALTAAVPLAKSDAVPASPARRRAIRATAGLPEGFRHEMLSLQLAERFATSADTAESAALFLHLVASHHGYARPLAPVVPDAEPPGVGGSARGGVVFQVDAAERRVWTVAHRLDSGIADRFWRLVRRHGWWGLAYLEAILRLSDWYASTWLVSQPERELVEIA